MKDDVTDLKHSLYDQGLNQGTESFNDVQKRLYDYLDLLYYVETDGFNGFLYNNVDKDVRMPGFVQCLFYFGFPELSQQLEYIYLQAKDQQWEETEGWEDFLTRLRLTDKVDALEKYLYQAIAGYLIDDWTEQHYTVLSAGIIIRKR
jgi:hypothetical protein